MTDGLPDDIYRDDRFMKWWRCPECFREQSRTLFTYFRGHEEAHNSQHAPRCQACGEIMEPMSPFEKP